MLTKITVEAALNAELDYPLVIPSMNPRTLSAHEMGLPVKSKNENGQFEIDTPEIEMAI